MPRPIYVICARGICEDKTTNLVSIFSALEKVTLEKEEETDEIKRAKAAGKHESHETRAVAVWMRRDGDENQIFEHQFVLKHRQKIEPLGGPQPFAFEKEKWLRRFNLTMYGLPTPDESCIVEFESRVRREGASDDDWVVQSYPLYFHVIDKTEEQQQVGGSNGATDSAESEH